MIRYPILYRVLANAGQAEFDSCTISFLIDKQFNDDDWDLWGDVRDQITTDITTSMGDYAASMNDIEYDEMFGQVSIQVEINLSLNSTKIPDDLLSTFDTACKNAIAKAGL